MAHNTAQGLCEHWRSILRSMQNPSTTSHRRIIHLLRSRPNCLPSHLVPGQGESPVDAIDASASRSRVQAFRSPPCTDRAIIWLHEPKTRIWQSCPQVMLGVDPTGSLSNLANSVTSIFVRIPRSTSTTSQSYLHCWYETRNIYLLCRSCRVSSASRRIKEQQKR